MGDISIIARRLDEKYVQYGWSGNGGYFMNVGARLLAWYNNKDSQAIDYLFDLGELSWFIPEPFTKDYTSPIRRASKPHSVGNTERSIFSKIAFIDYGYFYDSDQKWYYVQPGPFRIKYPLELISNNLNEKKYEFDFLKETAIKIIHYIFEEYYNNNPDFQALIRKEKFDIEAILSETCESSHPIHILYENYRKIFNYFDDWIVVEADETYCTVTGFRMKKKGEHIETIHW